MPAPLATGVGGADRPAHRVVGRAVAAARAAFDGGPWSRVTPEERQRALWTLADLIEANAQTIARIESLDNGKSAAVAQMVDVKRATQLYRDMAGWATKIEGATVAPSFPRALGLEVTAFIRKGPPVVVAAVVPRNFPFLITAMKLALAAGCTVVLKPAEQTPSRPCSWANSSPGWAFRTAW